MIERIKLLDITTQAAIVSHIQEVSHQLLEQLLQSDRNGDPLSLMCGSSSDV